MYITTLKLCQVCVIQPIRNWENKPRIDMFFAGCSAAPVVGWFESCCTGIMF